MDPAVTKEGVLIVDDEESVRFILTRSLEKMGYTPANATTLDEARELLNERPYFLVFLDIIMPDGSGFDLLESIKQRPGAPAVVVMTAQATMSNAVTAMKKGAFDYITKPFDLDEVGILVNRIVEYRKMSGELTRLKSSATEAPDELVGRSEPMERLYKMIGRAANTGVNILITGPTGSGKELVARALHYSSERADGPFLTVNCAAIPGELLESELFGHVKGAFTGAVDDRQGKFMASNGGSILLDEVGDMPPALQAKMLRVLQDGEVYPVGATRPARVDARVIASTNRDLEKEVADGRFREDLFHRLHVVHIETPPLSERISDIPLLVDHFIIKISKTFHETPKKIGPGVMETLMSYHWPGSVRELENVIRRAVIMAPGETVTPDDIPAELGGQAAGGEPIEELRRVVKKLAGSASEGAVYSSVIQQVETALIQTALNRTGGVQTRAAKLLGLNRNTLARKISELEIE